MVINYEMADYNARINYYEKHEEYNKQNKDKRLILSHLVYPISVFVFIIQIMNQLANPSFVGWALTALNGILVLFGFLAIALLTGIIQQKPRITVKLATGEEVDGYFIRWENNCLRLVPKQSGSMLIPREKIETIVYPMPELKK